MSVARLVKHLSGTPAFHLADQALSSGTNFVAVVMVARAATPGQFGVFSVFLIAFFVAAGFNRSVPHAIAMTMEWDDERARNSYFFLPPLVVGAFGTLVLVVTFAVLDSSWIAMSLLFLPLLVQDAVRMHAFAGQKPQVALFSDAVWLVVQCAGFLLVTTATGAAAVWGLGGLCALVVTRPWRIRLRLQRRPIRANVVSAGLEFATLSGLSYLTPLLASPIITVVGVGALQGANVIRGPIILLVQGLVFHRMSGPPITASTCIREARRLGSTTLGATLLLSPPILLLRGLYGPLLLGSTWQQVEPLVLPALLTMAVGSVGFGPATVIRKMGRFALSAKVQGALSPLFVVLPLAAAAADGPRGFLYATALAFGVSAVAWWMVLMRVASRSVTASESAMA